MIDEAFFIILTLISIGILLLKLTNVMKFGDLYGPEYAVVGIVAATIVFAFIFLMTIYNAPETTGTELVVYLWLHSGIYATTFVLTIGEIFMFFKMLGTRKGIEKYGQRQRMGQQ